MRRWKRLGLGRRGGSVLSLSVIDWVALQGGASLAQATKPEVVKSRGAPCGRCSSDQTCGPNRIRRLAEIREVASGMGDKRVRPPGLSQHAAREAESKVGARKWSQA